MSWALFRTMLMSMCSCVYPIGLRRHDSFKYALIFRRQQFRAAVTSANDMRGLARREQFMVRVAKQFVGKLYDAVARLRNARTDSQHLVVARGMLIAAMRIGDDDVEIVFLFHALVLDAKRANQFYAAYLEPHQIIRVVDHAHLVGLGVAHPYCRVVIFDHSHVLSIEALAG